MAARENQGYIILIIVLFLFVILLGLGSFFGIQNANEYSAKSKDLEVKLKASQNLASAQQVEAEVLKAYAGGFGPDITTVQAQIDQLDSLGNGLEGTQRQAIEDVKKRVMEITDAYRKDELEFLPNKDGDKLDFTWREHARNLSTILGDKYQDLQTKDNQLRKEKNDMQAEIDKAQQEIAAIRTSLVSAQTDLEAAKAAAVQVKQAWDQERLQLQENLSQVAARTGQIETALNGQIALLKTEKDRVIEANEILSTKIAEFTRDNFDVHDGAVVRVSPDINLVHVDIGFDDGLRPNQPFTIYSYDVTDFEKGQHKATIEITKVTGAHRAEAKIKFENPVNPIERGDKLVSPTWDPGYSVPIALIGYFDLDFDNTPDVQKLIRKVERNGGRVVAYTDQNGNTQGSIDAATRYAVIGGEPPLGLGLDSGDDSDETRRFLTLRNNTLNSINELNEQSTANYVQEIDIRKFLNWMGEHAGSSNKVERLDGDIGFDRRSPPSDR